MSKVAIVALFPLLTQAPQKPANLADFLTKSNLPNRLVVDAENTTSPVVKPDLGAFGRKEVQVGAISAIVPRQMVLIDDSLTEAPNLYDGLPRAAKVLYLLSTLDPNQLKLSTGPGIGLSDLRGEQPAVFRSLLPDTLGWSTVQIDKDGFPQPQGNETTVGSDQMRQVKLRLSRQIMLVPTRVFPDGRTGFSYMDSAREQVPGQVVRMRFGKSEDDETRLYGVVVRRTVPNQTKKSDLDYSQSRWKATVNVPAHATIREILSLIGASTKTEFSADFRVQNLSVGFGGGRARAGDLLQSLALAVTGTFRKVGDSFLLTSDIEGQGARQLKLALWASKAEGEAERKAREWRIKVGISGALKAIGFSADDPSGPNDVMRARLQQEDGAPVHKPIPVTDLSQVAQNTIARWNSFSNGQPKIELAGVSSRIVYSYVLPDGTALEPEHDELGRADQFFEPAPRTPVRPSPPVTSPIALRGPSASKSIIVHPTDAASAEAVMEAAASYGFGGIWLDTLDASVLRSAIAKGEERKIAVGLVIRPWHSGEGEAQSDRDVRLLGVTETSPFISPSSAAASARVRAATALARTPGLSGVVILQTLPPGYEPGYRLYGFPISEISRIGNEEYGYALGQRIEFLRANAVDPIDIALDGLQMSANLRVPFFDDPFLSRANTRIQTRLGLTEKWRSFRSEANRKASERFFTSLDLGTKPIYVEPRLQSSWIPYRGNLGNLIWAIPWTSIQALPTTDDRSISSRGPDGSLGISSFSPLSAATDEAVGQQLRFIFQATSAPVALDLSEISAAKAIEFMARWLSKK